MILDLVPRVRKALAVSSSYEDTDIPDLISESINRLLRDYHFPKAVQKATFANALLNDRSFALPAGFKKEMEVRYFDPTTSAYSDPLIKRENFQLPYPSGVPYYYWLEGTNLVVDTPYPAAMVGFSTLIWFESMDVSSNETWITSDFASAVRLFSIVRGAAEFRKPEVAQVYGALWTDEQASLAIYLNELEWNNANIQMKEPRVAALPRYPA